MNQMIWFGAIVGSIFVMGFLTTVVGVVSMLRQEAATYVPIMTIMSLAISLATVGLACLRVQHTDPGTGLLVSEHVDS